jgi:hypothetical protein
VASLLESSSPQQSASGVTSEAYTFSTNPAVGNKVIVGATNWGTSGPPAVSSVTDNYGNTYTKRADDLSSQTRVTLWDCDVATTGASFTVTVTYAATSDESCTFQLWSGLGAYDTSATGHAGDGFLTSISTASTGTLATSKEVLISVFGAATGNSSSGITAPSGYTLDGIEQNSSAFIGHGMAHQSVSSNAAVSATWNFSTTTSGGNGAAIVAAYIDPVPNSAVTAWIRA